MEDAFVLIVGPDLADRTTPGAPSLGDAGVPDRERERFISADRVSEWTAAAELVGLPLPEFVVVTLDRASLAFTVRVTDTLDIPMPLQNRVTPLGELIADPARGLVYGNRGCLHDETGRIRRRYAGKRWIACQLEFRDWHRHPLLQPGRFTELFFLDEATAFAAGHRPCALCRREDYNRFSAIWRELHPGQAGADAIDAQLHAERVSPGTLAQLRHAAELDELPDGAFVLDEGVSYLVLGAQLLEWTAAGYVRRTKRPARRRVVLVTPPSLVSVLRAGWQPLVPLLHPSSRHALTATSTRTSGVATATLP